MTADITVRPGNPFDFRREELQPLIEQIGAETGLSVEYAAREQRGYGVTWWEVLIIYVGGKVLDGVTGQAVQLTLDAITAKVKEWIKDRRKRSEEEQPGRQHRPFVVRIEDENGIVLREFKIEPVPLPKAVKRKRPPKRQSNKPHRQN